MLRVRLTDIRVGMSLHLWSVGRELRIQLERIA